MPPPPAADGLHSYSFAAAAHFSSHAARLRPLLSQLLRAIPDSPPPPPPVATALRGLAADLEAAEEVLREYRERSKIYVLVHCRQLCGSLRERAAAMAAWLVLLEAEQELVGYPDLKKKMADLAYDLHQSDFKVNSSISLVLLLLLFFILFSCE